MQMWLFETDPCKVGRKQQAIFFLALWGSLLSGCFAQGFLEIPDKNCCTAQRRPFNLRLVKEASSLLRKIIESVDLRSPNVTHVIMEMVRTHKTPALKSFLEQNQNDTNILDIITRIVRGDTSPERDLPNSTDASSSCEDTATFFVLMGYMVLPMFLVCLFGNTFNVAVYTMEYFQKFVAVKMLAVKAVMNTLFVLCLLPKSFRVMKLWDPALHPTAEQVFWHSWPYLLTAMNTFGMCAMWLTVLMTLERYLYIAWPTRSRRWVTNRNFYMSFAVLFLITINLQAVYIYTRYISSQLSPSNQTLYLFVLREKPVYLTYEKIYHWLNLWLAIIIPLALLIFMSTVISYRLLYQNSAVARYSEQKRCINRITFSTTIVHLLLELPYVLIFGVAAVRGPTYVKKDPFFCYYHIVASFLNICNASVLFFIYMAFSSGFRQMFFIRIKFRKPEASRTQPDESTALGPGGGGHQTNSKQIDVSADQSKRKATLIKRQNNRRESGLCLNEELMPLKNNSPPIYSVSAPDNQRMMFEEESCSIPGDSGRNNMVTVELVPLRNTSNNACSEDTGFHVVPSVIVSCYKSE